jgi:hypothetical protein
VLDLPLAKRPAVFIAAGPLLCQYLLSARSVAMGYPLLQMAMLSLIPIHLPFYLRSPRVITTVGFGVAVGIGVVSYRLARRKPTAEEIERQRRELLASSGRITDGTIMDTMITEARNGDTRAEHEFVQVEESVPAPSIIVYNYRIAGVTYECAQDVSALADRVHGIRTDLPIQVRYSPRNPANSIVVAESWSGLRLSSSNPYHAG